MSRYDLWKLAEPDDRSDAECSSADPDDLRDEAFYREREELVPENDSKAA